MFGIEHKNQYLLTEGGNPGDVRRRARPKGKRWKLKKKPRGRNVFFFLTEQTQSRIDQEPGKLTTGLPSL